MMGRLDPPTFFYLLTISEEMTPQRLKLLIK